CRRPHRRARLSAGLRIPMATIRVPKTPARAFNKNRPPSSLLRSQIAHLEWAVRPAYERKPHQLPKVKVKTEGQAAERIAELTARLHPKAAKPAVVGDTTAAQPPVPTPKKKRQSAARKKTTRRRGTSKPL